MYSVKIRSFNYILRELFSWYFDVKGFKEIEEFNVNNDFNLIKVMKLLYFVTTSDDNDYTLLVSIFSDFYALPYGPVEGETYDYIKLNNHKIGIGEFHRNSFKLKTLYLDEIPEYCDKIDNAISKLKTEYPDLILLEPFELVRISQKRLSWSSAYSSAEISGTVIQKMSLNLIKKETKYLK